MTSRSATEALKGYFYQFDHTILQILGMSSNAICTVEGTEDIDISQPLTTTAIQCKYHEGQEYNHSKIKKAVQLMLRDYHQRKTQGLPLISYVLYGHFENGQEKLVLPLTLDCLKTNFLTYSEKKTQHILHDELEINDDDLREFSDLLKMDLAAGEYDFQHSAVISLIKETMSCTDFDAEHYYYNNALNLVRGLAIEHTIDQRKISRQSFLEQIDKKELLFGQWFLQIKGEDAYIKAIRKEYFTSANIGRKNRFFIIDASKFTGGRAALKNMLELISEKYSKLSKREAAPLCPYIYFHGAAVSEMLALKNDLFDEGFGFCDGHPFKGASFKVNQIHKDVSILNGVRIKIIDDLDHLDEAIESSSISTQIYQFFSDEPFYETDNERFLHIRIQVPDPQMIKRIV